MRENQWDFLREVKQTVATFNTRLALLFPSPAPTQDTAESGEGRRLNEVEERSHAAMCRIQGLENRLAALEKQAEEVWLWINAAAAEPAEHSIHVESGGNYR